MRNKILTREAVLEAAETIIREDGLSACSMRRISGSLGVAVGTIYNYYETREALLTELFAEHWSRTVANVSDAVRQHETAENQLGAFVEQVIEEVNNENGLGRAVYDYKCENEKWIVGKTTIRDGLQKVLYQILEQEDSPIESARIISQWIVTIVIDALTTNRSITKEELSIFNQMIQMNVCYA